MQLLRWSDGIFVSLQRGGTKESIGRGKFYLSKQERHVVMKELGEYKRLLICSLNLILKGGFRLVGPKKYVIFANFLQKKLLNGFI